MGVDAVDDERVVVRQLHRPKADPVPLGLVQVLVAHPVRPPERRLLDAQQLLAVELDHTDAVLEPDLRMRARRRIQRDRTPDSLMNQSRAEVPAVAHPALVHAHTARTTDLRLARRRRMHDDVEQVVAGVDCDAERGEGALVEADFLAVKAHRCRVIDSAELDRARPLDPAPVDPGALRHPFHQAAVTALVGIGHLPGAPEVVEHAPWHTRRHPPVRLPRLAGVPPPFLAQAAA